MTEKKPPTAGQFVMPRMTLRGIEKANSVRGKQAQHLRGNAAPVTLPKLKFMEGEQ